jgi:outer membrane lipoprotein-sorting protein
MMLLFLLLATPRNNDDALGRYTAYMSKAQTLSVQLKTEIGGSGITGIGTLTFARPARIRFAMTAGNQDYVYGMTEDGGAEIDRSQKLYDDLPPTGNFTVLMSNLTTMVDIGLPQVLLRKDLREMMPQGAVFKTTGKGSVGGDSTDIVESHASDDRGKSDVTAEIDASGRLLKLHYVQESMRGRLDVRYSMSNYVVNKEIPKSFFVPTIPQGYVPFSMPTAPKPVEAGKPVVLGEWTTTAGGKAVNLDAVIKGRQALVLIADPETAPSQRMLPVLDAAARKLLGKGGRYVVISTASDPAAARKLTVNGVVYDPSGARLRDLRLPGAPLVYLVGKDGNLVQAWFGYDPSQDASLKAELDEALQRAGIQ